MFARDLLWGKGGTRVLERKMKKVGESIIWWHGLLLCPVRKLLAWQEQAGLVPNPVTLAAVAV